MAVALWSWGPVASWPRSALVLASARPRASLGNALSCVRHVLSRFRKDRARAMGLPAYGLAPLRVAEDIDAVSGWIKGQTTTRGHLLVGL